MDSRFRRNDDVAENDRKASIQSDATARLPAAHEARIPPEKKNYAFSTPRHETFIRFLYPTHQAMHRVERNTLRRTTKH
jgi:hypothetical protein